jgi:hypothetical protein
VCFLPKNNPRKSVYFPALTDILDQKHPRISWPVKYIGRFLMMLLRSITVKKYYSEKMGAPSDPANGVTPDFKICAQCQCIVKN